MTETIYYGWKLEMNNYAPEVVDISLNICETIEEAVADLQGYLQIMYTTNDIIEKVSVSSIQKAFDDQGKLEVIALKTHQHIGCIMKFIVKTKA